MSNAELDDPSMILGLHGILDRHPWIDRVSAEYDLDEDVFSLAVKRAAAYGWSSTHLSSGSELGGQRWGHNDAGGDWTQDGRVRQIAWLQLSPAEDLNEQRLPVLPAATVLGDALRRVGRFRLTGLHALVPLRLAPDSGFDLVSAADWFALADPDGSAELTVTLSAGDTTGLDGRAGLDDRVQEVCDLARERTHGRMAIEAISAPGSRHEGLSLPLAGELQTIGMREVMAFRCGAREWSLDVATWTIEIFIDALRATGTVNPVLLTVSGPAGPASPAGPQA